MKKLFLPLFLAPFMVSGQIRSSLSIDVGYSTVAVGGMPTIGLNGEAAYHKVTVETGLLAHSDRQNIAFGFLGAGTEFRQFAVTAGVVYGGGQPVQDRYIDPYGDTALLHAGAATGHFWDWYASWRIYPLKTDAWYMGVTYSHGVAFIRFGFRVWLMRKEQ